MGTADPRLQPEFRRRGGEEGSHGRSSLKREKWPGDNKDDGRREWWNEAAQAPADGVFTRARGAVV